MQTSFDDTIVAPATVPGAGAISVLRLSGSGTFAVLDRVVAFRRGTCADFGGHTLHFGTVSLPDGQPLDDVLVSIFRAPHSYTGEDAAEISCHASSYIVTQLLMLLTSSGARLAEAGEFTKRAYFHGKMDLAQAESVADLIASEDAAAHRVAFNQMRGGYSQELRTLRDQLLEMTALMELELDFSEEDVEFADRKKLHALLDTVYGHVQHLAASFRLGNAIRNGIPVTLAGKANTGKSTLLNALLGDDRALVSDIAGTTRDTIEEVVHIGGSRFRFIDTAGIREAREQVEKMGIERSLKKIAEADIVLGVVDVSEPQDSVKAAIDALCEKVHFDQQQLVILLNKCDLIVCNKNVIDYNKYVSSIDNKVITFYISAKTGEGLEQLRNWLTEYEKNRITNAAQATLVTNLRHYQALKAAGESLVRVREGLDAGIPTDLVSQDLREAISTLSSILGDSPIDAESTLSLIFSRFCIGK